MSTSASIPTNWRKPTTTQSAEERIQKANASIQLNLAHVFQDSNTRWSGDPGLLFDQIVTFDRLTNLTHSNPATLLSNIQNIISMPGFLTRPSTPVRKQYCAQLHLTELPISFEVNYPLYYGYAAIHAYQLYNLSEFLTIAQTVWEFGNKYTVSPAQASAGLIPQRNLTLCQPSTGDLSGGSFWEIDSALINALSTGYFLILSTLLADITSNSTYKDAATTSYNFYLNNLYSNSSGSFEDGIHADTCNRESSWAPVDSALFIEGAFLYDAIVGNHSAQHLPSELARQAIISGSWQDENGILSGDDVSGGYGQLIRSLVMVRDHDEDLRELIDAFISVQYNAVLDFAASGDDKYQNNWNTYDPSAPYSFHNETNAIHVLLAGMHLTSIGSSAPTSTAPAPPTTAPPAKKSPSSGRLHVNIAAIIGGIIALVIVLVSIFTFVYWRKRRLGHASIPAPEAFELEATRDKNIESHSISGRHPTGSGSTNNDAETAHVRVMSTPVLPEQVQYNLTAQEFLTLVDHLLSERIHEPLPAYGTSLNTDETGS